MTLPSAGASDQETAITAKAFSIGNRLPRTAHYQFDNLDLKSLSSTSKMPCEQAEHSLVMVTDQREANVVFMPLTERTFIIKRK